MRHVALQCHVVVATDEPKKVEQIVCAGEDKGEVKLLSNKDTTDAIYLEAIDTCTLSCFRPQLCAVLQLL